MALSIRFLALFFSAALLLAGASGIAHYRAGVAVSTSGIGWDTGTPVTAAAPATQDSGIGWD